jgi:transposase
MTSSDRQVSTSLEADTKQADRKRRSWPAALKRDLVLATLEPGASVSIIARRHDVNANQLFKWRRQLLGSPQAPAGLLLVEVVPEPMPAAERSDPPTSPGRIEVALPGGVRVRIEGAVDPAAVTAALAAVAKARRRR